MWGIVRNFARILYLYVAATANANPYRQGSVRTISLRTTLVLTPAAHISAQSYVLHDSTSCKNHWHFH